MAECNRDPFLGAEIQPALEWVTAEYNRSLTLHSDAASSEVGHSQL